MEYRGRRSLRAEGGGLPAQTRRRGDRPIAVYGRVDGVEYASIVRTGRGTVPYEYRHDETGRVVMFAVGSGLALLCEEDPESRPDVLFICPGQHHHRSVSALHGFCTHSTAVAMRRARSPSLRRIMARDTRSTSW